MKLLMKKKIGFVGCGNMGSAIVESLVSHEFTSLKNIYVFDIDKSKSTKLVKKYKVSSIQSFEKMIATCDVLILAVKPQNIDELLVSQFKGMFKNKLVISILAGITISRLTKLVGSNVKIIRSMPNLGVLVNCGVTALCKNKHATLRDLFLAQKFFSCSGTTVTIPEKHFNVVTAISGSGPAYYFYLTERLIAEGVKQGLSYSSVEMLATKTAEAASLLMARGPFSAEELRKKVTSKGGTTEAALSVMVSSQYKRLFSSAITKAVTRGEELSK